MKKHLQKFLLLLSVAIATSASAQNEVYWKEGFEPSAVPACDLGTVAPTATGGAYFNGNTGSWYGFNVYRTTGTGCPAGNNHVRYKNISGVTDSGYLITPVVDFGINEVHFLRARASRSYTLWITSDTNALTATWTPVTLMKSSAATVTCVDTMVLIGSATAKRLKIVGRPGTDTDVDSVWITSVNHIMPVKFGGISAAEANGMIKLNWNIESETNINSYVIERANAANEFMSVGSLNSAKTAAYNWVDKTPNNGVNYYRIKAIGTDGKLTYSNTIKVVIGKQNAELQVYPNPAKGGKLNIQVTGVNKGDYKVNIYSVTGALVYTTSLNSEGTSVAKAIDLSAAVKNGTYTVEITNGAFRTVKSVIVQ